MDIEEMTKKMNYAAEDSKFEEVINYLDQGADPNVNSRVGPTTTHWVALRGSVKTFKYCLEKGGDPFKSTTQTNNLVEQLEIYLRPDQREVYSKEKIKAWEEILEIIKGLK